MLGICYLWAFVNHIFLLNNFHHNICQTTFLINFFLQVNCPQFLPMTVLWLQPFSLSLSLSPSLSPHYQKLLKCLQWSFYLDKNYLNFTICFKLLFYNFQYTSCYKEKLLSVMTHQKSTVTPHSLASLQSRLQITGHSFISSSGTSYRFPIFCVSILHHTFSWIPVS